MDTVISENASEASQLPEVERPREDNVSVTVEYLPATKSFHQRYPGRTPLATVRTDAMTFFGVRDRQERDRYEYFLVFEGRRLTNLAETLRQLLGAHSHEATFHLVEQITPGDFAA